MTSSPAISALVVHPADNVAVALGELARGQVIEIAGRAIRVVDGIPCGHKIALTPLSPGDAVVKYGQPMGLATCPIGPGEWVHLHNVRSRLEGAREYVRSSSPAPVEPLDDGLSFEGYPRDDGQVGIRNEIWVLPTVGCVNHLVETAVARLRERGLPPGIDAAHGFTHPFGCSQLGDDLRTTARILAGLSRHPNAAAVLVIGLGCENNGVDGLRRLLGEVPPERLRFLVAQDAGDEVADALGILCGLSAVAARARRQAVPLARLRVGLKCGGSDAFSGLTANPVLGAFSDALIRRGGSTVLTEVPEMFGAEALFMGRCATPEAFSACAGMVNAFKEYFLRHGQPVDGNPSPGNRDGGITTLEEKALGCLQKGGTSPVVDILPYGGRLSRPGLTFLDGPGNDIVSASALAAAGAHLTLFTTGRGTPLGSPVPVVKVASTSALAARKPHWIDFDAGRVLGGRSIADLAQELLRLVVDVASGRCRTRSEVNGCREFAIWKDGVTL